MPANPTQRFSSVWSLDTSCVITVSLSAVSTATWPSLGGETGGQPSRVHTVWPTAWWPPAPCTPDTCTAADVLGEATRVNNDPAPWGMYSRGGGTGSLHHQPAVELTWSW